MSVFYQDSTVAVRGDVAFKRDYDALYGLAACEAERQFIMCADAAIGTTVTFALPGRAVDHMWLPFLDFKFAWY